MLALAVGVGGDGSEFRTVGIPSCREYKNGSISYTYGYTSRLQYENIV
jgi:hypothetical protein